MALSNYYSGQQGQPQSMGGQPVGDQQMGYQAGQQTQPMTGMQPQSTSTSYGATGTHGQQWGATNVGGRPLGTGNRPGMTGSGTLRTWWFKIKTSIRRCLPPWNRGRTLA